MGRAKRRSSTARASRFVWLALAGLGGCTAPPSKTVTVPAEQCAEVVRELAGKGDSFAVNCVSAAGSGNTIVTTGSQSGAGAADPGTAYSLPGIGNVYH